MHGDQITQRVIANAFHPISEEMRHRLIRVTNSSLFTRDRDFFCTTLGPDAELIAAADGTPGFHAPEIR